MAESEEQSVRRSAMDLLARREHSFSELTRKLKSRFAADAVKSALMRLVSEGLQSDERFTEAFVYSRSGKGYGPRRIRSELMVKGIKSDLIGFYLFEDDERWFAEAQRLCKKKFGNIEFLSAKDKVKPYRYLTQRGFLSSHINACLNS